MSNTVYVAFLRGINVGGNSMIKMEELKKVFETLGLGSSKTLLNSGNVIFESHEQDVHVLTKKIEETLEHKFGWNIAVMLRSRKEMQSLVDSHPFIHIKRTDETRLYVTFLSEKPTNTLKIPYESAEKDFQILQGF